MGRLFYGNTVEPLSIDDTMLAHVKVVMATKLRRSETFTMSWAHSSTETPGRSTIWIHPAIPLRFVFDTAEPALLDSQLLKRYAEAASSASGLMLDNAPTSTSSRQREAIRA